MRSGSERMHTWRRTPSTWRNFQTLIIWITVSYKASCNGSFSVNNFFSLDFFNFLWLFKSSRFLCHSVYSVKNTAGSNKALPSVQGVNGVNGCTTCECNDIVSVNQKKKKSCSYVNVNVTSELHAKSAKLGGLTLPTFSDSTKQVPLHFIRDLDQYFSLRHLTNYAYHWHAEQSRNLSQSSGFPFPLINVKVTIS